MAYLDAVQPHANILIRPPHGLRATFVTRNQLRSPAHGIYIPLGERFSRQRVPRGSLKFIFICATSTARSKDPRGDLRGWFATPRVPLSSTGREKHEAKGKR